MRDKNTILLDHELAYDFSSTDTKTITHNQKLILEVLLDIRELLLK